MTYCLFARFRSLGLAAAGVGVAVLMSATPAGAATRTTLLAGQTCDSATLTQPFSQWGDTNEYKLVTGGSFESSPSSWTLTGGAQTVAGSEPFGVTGSLGSSSLDLPAGASAQSPTTCVSAAYPTFRLFAHTNGVLSTVLVQVVYQVPLLGSVAIPVGTIALNGAWSPTVPMLTASAIPGLLSGGTAQVALRFTALTGDSQIDDVFVDPRMHH
jgi:hypothetical protein